MPVIDLILNALGSTRGAREFDQASGKTTRSARKAEDAVEGLSNEMGDLEGSVSKASFGLRDLAVTLGVVGAIRSTVTSISDYQTELAKLEGLIISSGQAAQMQEQSLAALAETNRTLGRDTSFAASQVAAAQNSIVRSGQSVAETNKTVASVLNLAKAETLGLADASSIVTKVLSQYSLQAEEAGRVTDVLFAASTGSNSKSVSELFESFKLAGVNLAALNVDLEESAALIGTLANAGISGSTGGTAIRQIINNLIKPTAEARLVLQGLGIDSAELASEMEGSLIPVLKRLNATQVDYLATAGIFDARTTAAAKVLIANASAAEAFAERLRGAEGAAAAFAEVMGSTLQGRLAEVNSKIEDLQISLGDAGLTSLLEDTLSGVSSFLESLPKAFGELSAGENIIRGLVTVIGAGGLLGVLLKVGAVASSIPLLSIGGAGLLAGGIAGLAGEMSRYLGLLEDTSDGLERFARLQDEAAEAAKRSQILFEQAAGSFVESNPFVRIGDFEDQISGAEKELNRLLELRAKLQTILDGSAPGEDFDLELSSFGFGLEGATELDRQIDSVIEKIESLKSAVQSTRGEISGFFSPVNPGGFTGLQGPTQSGGPLTDPISGPSPATEAQVKELEAARAQFEQTLADLAASIELETSVVGLSAREREKALVVAEAELAALEGRTELSESARDSLLGLVDSLFDAETAAEAAKAAEEALEESREASARQAQQNAERISRARESAERRREAELRAQGSRFTDALIDPLRDFERSTNEIFRDIFANFRDAALEQFVLGPLEEQADNLFASILGGISGNPQQAGEEAANQASQAIAQEAAAASMQQLTAAAAAAAVALQAVGSSGSSSATSNLITSALGSAPTGIGASTPATPGLIGPQPATRGAQIGQPAGVRGATIQSGQTTPTLLQPTYNLFLQDAQDARYTDAQLQDRAARQAQRGRR